MFSRFFAARKLKNLLKSIFFWEKKKKQKQKEKTKQNKNKTKQKSKKQPKKVI